PRDRAGSGCGRFRQGLLPGPGARRPSRQPRGQRSPPADGCDRHHERHPPGRSGDRHGRQGRRQAHLAGRVAHPAVPGGTFPLAQERRTRRRPRDPFRRRGSVGRRGRAADGGMMLDRILDSTRSRLPDLVMRTDDIVRQATEAPPPPPLAAALRGDTLTVIAEVKRRSPSRGPLDLDLDPVTQASRYAAGGAAGISVLTEPEFFSGSDADLTAVATATRLPVLRKDFTLEPVQVWEARALGASAVLLIVAALDDRQLRRLIDAAEEAGLDALVEVHTTEEASRAVDAGAVFVGVNNRDLHTFDVDLATAENIAPLLEGVAVTVA